MTRRERWLWCGLVSLFIAIIVLSWWQFRRYVTARTAVQQFIALQGQSTPKDKGQAAHLQQTRLSMRELLAAGDWDGALKRYAQLTAYHAPAPIVQAQTTEIAINKLWPPRSKARARARQILLLLIEKQTRGYDVTMAQQALLEVAQQARNGNKKLALAAFARIADLLKASKVQTGMAQTVGLTARPGPAMNGLRPPPNIRPPNMGPPPNMGQAPSTPSPGQTGDPRIENMVQFFQTGLPQALAGAPPQQRPFLLKLQAFGNEFVAAYRQGKDLRGVVAMLEKAGPPGVGGDMQASLQKLDQALIALRNAPRLSNPRLAPMPVPPGGVPPGSAASGAPPPNSMGPGPNSAPGKGSPVVGAERVLQFLDAVHSMPEPVYRRQRSGLAAAITQLAGGNLPAPTAAPVRTPAMRPGATPSTTPRATPSATAQVQPKATPTTRTTPTPSVPAVPDKPTAAVKTNTGDLWLDIDRWTVIRGLHAFGHDLSAGLKPGGFFLLLPDRREVALSGTLRPAGALPPGGLSVTSRVEGHGMAIDAFLNGQQPAGTSLMIKLPLQAQGWTWQVSSKTAKIGSRGVYLSNPEAGKDGLKPVTLIGPAIRLTIAVPRASSIAFDASAKYLVRFPVNVSDAETSYTIHLAASK